MSQIEVCVFGFLGGLLPDILRLIKSRHEEPPQYLWSIFFWLCLFGLGLIGGEEALRLHATNIQSALVIGFSGPEIITRLLARPIGNEVASGEAAQTRQSISQKWEKQRDW